MATETRAETAQAMKEKYRKKRLTASLAAKYYLLDNIYWTYLMDECKPVQGRVLNEEKVANILSNDGEAFRLCTVYNSLYEWIASAFEAAVLMRNALHDYLHIFLASAQIDREPKDTLDVLSTCISSSYLLLQRRIRRNLCYMNAYNTLIEIIANQIKVPEFTVFQVDMSQTQTTTNHLNQAIDALKEKFEAYTGQIPEPYAPYVPECTQTIPLDAPPIPAKNLQRAEAHVKAMLTFPNDLSWYNAFEEISHNYWQR